MRRITNGRSGSEHLVAIRSSIKSIERDQMPNIIGAARVNDEL